MRSIVFILFCLCAVNTVAQQKKGPYIHSHNDYLQSSPLIDALSAGAKSIEIDVFLHEGTLAVAHTKSEIIPENTLENLYVFPLIEYVEKNKQAHDFHFMIDIKSAPTSTLSEIENTLKKYPDIFSREGVQVIISGNRPKPKTYNDYAEFIWFDGRIPRDAEGLGNTRIAMISQNLSKFTCWRGEGKVPDEDKNQLKKFIDDCHQQHKPVRVWNTGDSEQMYDFLLSMGVDYINTDRPELLKQFLTQNKKTTTNN